MAITPSLWQKVVPITIPASKVQGSHVNFTVLIDETSLPVELFSIARSDGGDLRFCLSIDGTNELARDIIRYNASGSALIAINLPSLTTVDKVIYCFYGNASATDYAHTDTYGTHNAHDSYTKAFLPLWESGNGTAGEFKDRTSNHNHGQGGGGTSSKVPTQSALLMNAGNDFDGSDDFIGCGNASSLNITGAITLELTLLRDTNSSYDSPIWKGNAVGTLIQYGIQIQPNSDNRAMAFFDSQSFESNGIIDIGIMIHLVATWDGTLTGNNVKLYCNGALDATRDKILGTYSSTDNFVIGAMPPTENYNPFDGKIAFVKICNTNRSADWIKTVYNNMIDPDTFAVVGTPQSTAVEKSYVIFVD